MNAVSETDGMDRNTFPYAHRDEPMTVLEPDHALASRALHDRAAFAELYQRYLTPIYGYCYRRLGSREAAEDATSLVFTKALEGLPNRNTANVRAWLFTIAHNVVVDSYRSHRVTIDLESVDTIASSGSPEDDALAAIQLGELRAALDLLTDDQRQVVELRLAGLTGPEIRDVLDRSRSWVDTTQHRAVQRLRQALAHPKELDDV